MTQATADLCDRHGQSVQVAEPLFRDFGGSVAFAGPIATVRALEDNTRVREALGTPGEGRVLVVDGAGSLRCALLGDRLASLALDNEWAGVVIYGCVRDTSELKSMALGIKALAPCPKRSRKLGHGERDVTVTFAGVRFEPGAHLYADGDGIIVSASAIEA